MQNGPGKVTLICDGPARWRTGPRVAQAADSLGEASGAVPPLWLGLFDFQEASVRRTAGRDALRAATALEQAMERAAALERVIPQADAPGLHLAAALLARSLGEVEGEGAEPRVVIETADLAATLDPAAARAYVKQLINLCDLWQRLRDGQWNWAAARARLLEMVPQIEAPLAQEQKASLYVLAGSLADRADDLSHLALREGQSREDKQPEALAVGDRGLLLGRFGGRWKLMASVGDADLHDVCHDGTSGYAVGDGGTLLEFQDGRWQRVDSPVAQPLYRVRPAGEDLLLAVGASGTVLARTAGAWQRLASPTEATLRAAWGAGPHQMCLGGDAEQVWRYDGYAWNAVALPGGAQAVTDIVSSGSRIAVVGTRAKQGDVFWLAPRGCQADGRLEGSAPIEGAFLCWDDQLGLVAADGQVLSLEGETWQRQRLRAHAASAASQGDIAALVGRYGKYGVIWENAGEGWEPTVALEGLVLRGIWCAGCAKPPRLKDEPPPATPETTV